MRNDSTPSVWIAPTGVISSMTHGAQTYMITPITVIITIPSPTVI